MTLPIEPVLPEVCRALAASGSAVLQAPPGAGKTTRVPLALLDEEWVAGRRIVMLEPRRLAARAAARRMAWTLRESVGETVGYRMRLDTKVGPRTRIEVVTEGILVRMLQRDPALDGVAAVIFDEFHERSLDADLGLALCLEARAALRPDLRLLVMSATLDGAAVARLLGDAPIVTSEGKMFPVETRWIDPGGEVERALPATIRRALREDEGDILVFLPGAREIRRAERALAEEPPDAAVLPLYGDLPQEAQDAALGPSARRKIVLATSIAETSLTIEGVRIVVDSGLMRRPRFDPRSGMTRLETVKVSQASADQRRGRAGRTAPGVCWRLWTEAAHRVLPAQTRPEIMEADLAPLALELATWGTEAEGLAWLDPPPEAALGQARALLRELGALDEAGRITAHGKAIAAFGAHPRLAHMMIAGKALGAGGLGCDIAALLSGRDPIRGERDADLRHRLELLRDRGGPGNVDRGAIRQAADQARLWRRQLGTGESGSTGQAGQVLALAYPDRIGQRRPGPEPRYRLSNGSGGYLPAADPLGAADWLAIAELDGDKREARIFLAAPVTLAEIETAFADRIASEDSVAWDPQAEAVVARRRTRLGDLTIAEKTQSDPPREQVRTVLLGRLRQAGIAALPWSEAARTLLARIRLIQRAGLAEGWPDFSDAALLDTLDEWLGPFLDGISRRAQLERIDLANALAARLDWAQRRRLDELAPTHLEVPSGRTAALDYLAGEVPVLAAKLQEMFGATDTPAIAGGRIKLLVHLLSPAGRPLQVTQDLAGFWSGTYRQVRAEMKGRYPKHPWPDDPLSAPATARTKRRME